MSLNPVQGTMHRRSPDERGIALLVAIALMALVGMLLLVMVTVAIRDNNASGRDRQRSSGVMTAEGQVDTLISKIQSASPDVLPCGPLTTPSISVGPDTMALASTVTYYNAAGAVLTCPLSSTVVAAKASIRSTSTSNRIASQAPAVRTVETLLALTPTYKNELSKAIYGAVGLTLDNNVTVTGKAAGKTDADIYTSGNLTCKNSQHYWGTIYAQGTVTLQPSCIVEKDVYARMGFIGDTGNGAVVKGRIESSRGTIDLVKTDVSVSARSKLAVPTGDACSPVGKCFLDLTLTDPPTSAFPVINWDSATAAAWAAAPGYFTNVVTNNVCDSKLNNSVGQWFTDNAATIGPNTVIRTSCRFSIPNNVSVVALAKDVAVVADGGIELTNSVTIQSSSADPHNLYFIQPYNSPAITNPCDTSGISLSNQVTLLTSISTLLYSPCNIAMDNKGTIFGQVYGNGKVKIGNNLEMTYRQVPVWGGGLESVVSSYAVDILYKRENNT
jgi:hypothetical protein